VSTTGKPALDSRPNVIYILSDDQRADYLGCAGHPVLRTPNLDNLAEEGVRFTNAFCTSPACTPSRTCHYLGQWERAHGVNFNSASNVSATDWEMSIPTLLKNAGYFTGWIGKNHVPVGEGGYRSGHLEQAFDYWYGNHGHSHFYPKEHGAGVIYRNSRFDTQVEVFQEGVNNFLQPDRRFLSSCERPLPERPTDKPFLLCVTFNLPHGAGTGTMQLRPDDDELYKSAYRDVIDKMPTPPTYRTHSEACDNPKIPRHVYTGKRIAQYDYVKRLHTLRERQVRTCQAIEGIDRFVGNLRQRLEELGLEDNTIIVYSTDHGLHHGEHGLGGKCLLYEQDIHIPMIVYDPRLSPASRGQERDEIVAVPDLAPTVLDLLNLSVPPSMQGRSLLPLLLGESTDWRTELFCEQLMDIQDYPRQECIRSQDWKYIRYFRRTPDHSGASVDGTFGTLEDYRSCLESTLIGGEQPIYEELYHLAGDPHEERNLATRAEHTDTLAYFRRRIVEEGRTLLADPR
jgi:arylsulfatase A-like enzyme